MGLGMLTCLGQGVNERLAQFICLNHYEAFQVSKYLHEAFSRFRVFLAEGLTVEYSCLG